MNAQLVELLTGISGFLVDHAACMPPEVHAGEWSRGYVEGMAAARELVLDALQRSSASQPGSCCGASLLRRRAGRILLAGRALEPGDEIELWVDGAWRPVRVLSRGERRPGELPLRFRAIGWSGGLVPKWAQLHARWPLAAAAPALPSAAQACALRLIAAVRAIDLPYESPLPRGVAAANLAACRLEELLDPRPAAQPAATP